MTLGKTAARRQLGAEMRLLRCASGKQQREMAVVIECDPSQISKVERGERMLKTLEVQALLEFLGATPAKRDKLMSLARVAAQRRPRRSYADKSLPGTLLRLGYMEQDSAEIFCSSGELVPALLRTPAYERVVACHSIDPHPLNENELAVRVDFLSDRQRVLDDTTRRLRFLVGEGALLRTVGDREVLREQLKHMVNVIDTRPWISIQVLPVRAAVHPMLDGSVTGLRFAGGVPDEVFQSTVIGGGIRTNDTAETRKFLDAFDKACGDAPGRERSRALVFERLRRIGA
ncbi:helix-turn-helix domain-containing protein [Amycolatopsis sp. NPDC059657]|uniref:helix-turn-helix domain-containing protein n=1 Tax=Amycolatopsis sp. NPDC059657 TaxID=3346899 RepID=UPI00366AAE15